MPSNAPRVLRESLIFYERAVSLKEILAFATEHFEDNTTIDNNLIYFEAPDYTGERNNDLILKRLPKTHFIKYEDGNIGTKIYGHRTLAQVIREARSSRECKEDFSNISLLWHHGELCMHIMVDKTDEVECGKISS